MNLSRLRITDFNLLLGRGSDGFVPSSPLLSVYGENWNGTTMSGHIGGTVVETGIVYSDATRSEINNKKAIRTNGANNYLTFTQLASSGVANYVVFEVRWMSFVPTNQSGSTLDFYDDTELSANLRIYAWLSDDAVSADERYWAGYGYGDSSNIHVAHDLVGLEDQTVAQVRVYIFEEGVGKYYRGGNLLITGGWQPVQLGVGNQRKRMGGVSGGNLTCRIGHLSLYEIPINQVVNKAWVNRKAQELADFYNLTWVNI